MELRDRVVKGGAYLIARQGLGLIIGLVGVMLITRAIGPGNFGLYATALGIVSYINGLMGLGVNVYLIRRENEPEAHVYQHAFTLMLITGGAGIMLGIAAMPLLQQWFQNPAFISPLLIMLLTVPVTVLTGPPMARLERDLNYRDIAVIELTGQSIYFIVAAVLAYQGRGVWAPVTGYVVWQVFLLICSCVKAKLTFRLYWSTSLAKEMVGYGAGYSISMWVWQLRSLVNPLIVGRYAGPEAVGYLALTIRLVEALSFVKGVTWRMSIAVFGKLQGDAPRFKKALEEAMTLQILTVGPLLALFAYFAPWLFNTSFDGQWDDILIMYPFIALSYLVNALFNMHSSVLYVLRRNWNVTIFHVVHILFFAGGVLWLLPRFGLPGYGMAEVMALLSYFVIHLQIKRLFNLSYNDAVPWLVSFLIPLFATVIPFPSNLLLWMPLLAVLLLCKPGKQIKGYIRSIITRD